MSEIIVPDIGFNMIDDAHVYDMEESIRAAKYSHNKAERCTSELTDGIRKLALAPIGSGHDCFLKGIRVSFDLRLSLKAWMEAERYGFFDIVTSESTMHSVRFASVLDICENDYVDPLVAGILVEKIEKFNDSPNEENFLGMIYNIPVGFMLTARISTNYMQLKTIYAQRKAHRLPEWRKFCEWIEYLPESWMITGKEDE